LIIRYLHSYRFTGRSKRLRNIPTTGSNARVPGQCCWLDNTDGIGQYYVLEQFGYNEHNIHATSPSTRISKTHSPLSVNSFPSNTRQRDTTHLQRYSETIDDK
jgi:hypothetical protein